MMLQLYEIYREQPKLAALSRESLWGHNLVIMIRCKREEEREFYLRLATRDRWPLQELQPQLVGVEFEPMVLSPAKVSALLTELHRDAAEDAHLANLLDGDSHSVHYICKPFGREPGFGVTSVNCDFSELLVRAEEPR